MGFLWLLLKLPGLLAAIAILELQGLYEYWAGPPVDQECWTSTGVTQEELFDGPEPWFYIVGRSGISFETQPTKTVVWTFLAYLGLLAARWIGDNEYRHSHEPAHEERLQYRLYELFESHVRRYSFRQYVEPTDRVYLRYESGGGAPKVLR